MDPDRPVRISVCGAGRADADTLRAAEDVGRLLAEAGAVVVTGGLGGVMEAASRGAASAGGLTLGVLPGRDARSSNPAVGIPLATGMGEARNALVVRFGEAVIAIGGEWGTLSEVALARKIGRPVVLLRPALAGALDLPTADTAESAVRFALDGARAGRRA